ncbi:hypothetical protein [Vibrio parahaemolyticus]|uniref:hypothetical protein n=1 Tax=Vibrio parahaemolyticus TaxID=670 RepID=UPI002B210437|nr:hypothetical protein [Vibrio parahaemolyticus]MEA5282082.1 hypothetical protein [Vibrio parahaemolyticus]
MTDSIEQRVAKLEEQAALEKKLILGMRIDIDFLRGREIKRTSSSITSLELEDAMTAASGYRARAAFLAGIFVGLIIAVFIFSNQ